MDAVNRSGLLVRTKPKKLARLPQKARVGLLFLSPGLIGFVLLQAVPILAAFVLSLTDFHMLTPEALMVGALVVMVVPVIVLFLSQRFLMQDMIVTQIEK
jgi:ABC-type sugar transport system permease subunit